MNKQQILDSAMQKAREGRFTEMTPQEMDAFRENRLQVANEHDQAIKTRQEIAQSKFPQKERNVYHYMKNQFDAIAVSSSGYDPDRDDDLVVSEAAQKFGISKQEATSIYMKLDVAGLDLK